MLPNGARTVATLIEALVMVIPVCRDMPALSSMPADGKLITAVRCPLENVSTKNVVAPTDGGGTMGTATIILIHRITTLLILRIFDHPIDNIYHKLYK